MQKGHSSFRKYNHYYKSYDVTVCPDHYLKEYDQTTFPILFCERQKFTLLNTLE